MFTLRPSSNFLLIALLIPAVLTAGKEPDARAQILGEAILGSGAFSFLEHISDTFGPRMIGTPAHEATMDHLETSLNELGIQTRRQKFTFPGWVRGESSVNLLEPFQRALRCAALGYVGSFDPVQAEVAYVASKDISEFDPEAITDRILLVRQNVSYSVADMHALKNDHGVRGLLYINRVNGGQLLARTVNHDGEPAPFPVLTITQEEGLWIKRMLEEEKSVRVRLETTAELRTFTGVNLIATLPGRSGERVILGGHFDSWDLGQGSIDNGLGVAQIYDVARILNKLSPENRHTVEFVWFDAEEFGLWGSYHYAKATDLSDVRVMVNLDMVGRPIAINAMGFDKLVPELERYSASLGAWEFSEKVANKPWLGSDHHPFILNGVPSITFNAPIDHDDVRYYHDFGDTLDKVDPVMLGEGTGLIGLLVFDLANSPDPRVPHLSDSEAAQLFRDAGLEDRLRKAGKWPFGEGE